MGKSSKRKKLSKRFVKLRLDDAFVAGPVSIERFGNVIRFSNTSTPEQHKAFLQQAEKANAESFKQLDVKVPLLQRHISRYEPLEIMHRAVGMLLPLFIQHKSEGEYSSEESWFLPTTEYLQYLIARTAFLADTKATTDAEWDELWSKATDVIRLTHTYLYTRKTLTSPPSPTDELRFILDGMRLGVRVHRYPFFLLDHLKTSLMPYATWIRQAYNVSVEEIIQGIIKIDEYQKTGIPELYRTTIAATDALMNKLEERGYTIGGGSPQDIVQIHKALESEFRVQHEELQELLYRTFTPAVFEITDMMPKLILSLLSVKPGEAILTELTGPGHDDLSPLSNSVLHHKPFLEVDEKFYTFYHSGFDDWIGELIEADLFNKFPDKVSEMAKARSNRLETDTKDLLTAVIHPDSVFQNIYYPNPEQAGNLTELDILLRVDDILFLVEVKAGGLSTPARRGAPKSLEQELSDLIIEGQHQSERAEKYIGSDHEVAFFDETGKNVVCTIKRSEIREFFRIVVTREQLGWVGARIACLSILDPNLSKSFPWHVSIDDLRVVVELFKDNEICFVHFLEERLRASSQTKLHQHDEIEHIGLYFKMNYYHEYPNDNLDFVSFDSSFMKDIDYYFMSRQAGETPDLPTQDMPSKVRDFVYALKDSRLPGRFEFGSMVLSMDSGGREKIWKALDYLDEGQSLGKQRSIRLPFANHSFGLTIMHGSDLALREELFRSAAQMEQSRCSRWLVTQLAGQSKYVVNVIQIVYPGKFLASDLLRAKTYLEDLTWQKIKAEKPGRNDMCPCGSGIKFKRCHGQ
ncbi:MAG: SEC-C domain-containing protein [Candidatus Omnitrophica bacterium]|nr:SEC-C domain-containing protein [Candidatus Omnitrophota bacterium]